MDFSASLHRGQIHARRRADPKCQATRGFPTSLSLPPAPRLHVLQGRGPNGTLCFHVKWLPEPGALPAKRHSRDNPASPGLQRPGPGKTSLSAQRGPGLAGQNHRAGCGSRLPLWGDPRFNLLASGRSQVAAVPMPPLATGGRSRTTPALGPHRVAFACGSRLPGALA